MTDTIHSHTARGRDCAPDRGLRAVLSGRRVWLALGGAALLAGAALNWNWLVLVGAAPILLKVLPSAAMCALGLCARGSCKTAGVAPPSSAAVPQGVSPGAPQ